MRHVPQRLARQGARSEKDGTVIWTGLLSGPEPLPLGSIIRGRIARPQVVGPEPGYHEVDKALHTADETFEDFALPASPLLLADADAQLSRGGQIDAVEDVARGVTMQHDVPGGEKEVPVPAQDGNESGPLAAPEERAQGRAVVQKKDGMRAEEVLSQEGRGFDLPRRILDDLLG